MVTPRTFFCGFASRQARIARSDVFDRVNQRSYPLARASRRSTASLQRVVPARCTVIKVVNGREEASHQVDDKAAPASVFKELLFTLFEMICSSRWRSACAVLALTSPRAAYRRRACFTLDAQRASTWMIILDAVISAGGSFDPYLSKQGSCLRR